MHQNLSSCEDWVGFSSTVDFGLNVYPFIFQTSSRLFILAIPSQPWASHTLPSGALSGFIPTAPALSRKLRGGSDPGDPECWAHTFVPKSSYRIEWSKGIFRIFQVSQLFPLPISRENHNQYFSTPMDVIL